MNSLTPVTPCTSGISLGRRRHAPLLIDGQLVSFEPRELMIFSMLFNARTFVPTITIEDALYGTPFDGGPEDPFNLIRSYVSRIRKKLRNTKFKVENRMQSSVYGRRHGTGCREWIGGWRLVRANIPALPTATAHV